jgi:hypothetical protein
MNLSKPNTHNADHGGRAVCGRNCLHSLERWDRGLESHSKAWAFVCAFILFVLPNVGSGIAMG